MHSVIISIGSNTPDKWERVAGALQWLSECTMSGRKSTIYSSLPEGNCASRIKYPYANAVYSALTPYPRQVIEEMLKNYEAENGRTPQMKQFGIVPIDLDLVYFDEELLRPVEITRSYFRRGYDEICRL